MDARTRSTSYGAGAGNRVYEDVQPQYRWVPSDKEDTLVVDLTGFKNEAEFKKEHLRIQIDNYGNLKVSGERPLGGLRWSRFQRVLHLPEDCDASGIRATFDDGILLVLMPKLVRDRAPTPAPTPQPAAATVQPAPPTPPPAKESPKGAAASSSTRQNSKLPAPVPAGSDAAPVAPPPPISSSMRRPPAEDRRSRGNSTVPDQQKSEQAQGAPPADDEFRRRKAAAADRKEVEPTPPVPAEGKITRTTSDPQVLGKTAAVELEDKETAAGWSETGTAGPRVVPGQHVGTLRGRQRPKQLLANVMVALLVLVGLGLYVAYRYNKGRQDGHLLQGHPAAPAVSIEED